MIESLSVFCLLLTVTIGKKLGESCLQDSECTLPNSACQQSVCRCETGTIPETSSDSQGHLLVQCKGDVNFACITDIDCRNNAHLQCLFNKCICMQGFSLSQDQKFCILSLGTYGNPCDDQYRLCGAPFVCTQPDFEGKRSCDCQAPATYNHNSNLCLVNTKQISGYGERCGSVGSCDSLKGLVCRGTCSCLPGLYYSTKSELCIPEGLCEISGELWYPSTKTCKLPIMNEQCTFKCLTGLCVAGYCRPSDLGSICAQDADCGGVKTKCSNETNTCICQEGTFVANSHFSQCEQLYKETDFTTTAQNRALSIELSYFLFDLLLCNFIFIYI